MGSITPILLAGGSGTRLWPSSRKTYPKQFTKLTSNESLFQQSALKFVNIESIEYNSIITVTNSLFRFIVREQLEKVGLDSGRILIEPEAKNTAPAILAATLLVFKDNPEAILIAVPSDHLITDNEYFNEAIKVGYKAAKNGKIVTFGIQATRPETGYGYLQIEKDNKLGPKKIIKFIEKPSMRIATNMLKDGNYLWNSGIFMFRAVDMICAFEKYAQNILTSVNQAVELSDLDMEFIKLDQKSWANINEISIDYAIMEKVNNLIAVPYNSSWSDLGDWDSVWRETKRDQNGVALSKNAHAIECKNSLLRSENETQQLVGLGLHDIVAIAMPDAVLVANKNKSQDVRGIVEYLKSQKIQQSELFPKDHRPWGWFENVASGSGFQVKKIFVNPGAALSLQKHKFRSEHWVVVKGLAKITIDNDIKLIEEGQSTFVPLGSVHRLENPGKDPIIMIEVQIGSYLGEDDIIRYEDNYSRK